MASNGGDDGPDLSVHPLARGLQRAASEERRVGFTTLLGYIGPSPEDEVHIYIDLSFDTYCVVARDDVVNAAPADLRDENSPTYVWVKREATVRLISTQVYTADADFVAGAIVNMYPDQGSSDEGIQAAVKKSAICTSIADCVIKPPPPPLKTAWTCPHPK